MITKEVILKEIDDGCYGKCNDKAKDTLIKNIETLEDLESLNEINEYEVDKAFLDKMKYIKEHKNETDNLVYTGGLDFFSDLKQALERSIAEDWKRLDSLKENAKQIDDKLTDPHVWENEDEAHNLQKQSADIKAEIKKIENRFEAERDDFMEHYEVPKAPDIEIPEAVLRNLDADDIYIYYDTEDNAYLFLGKDKFMRVIDISGKPDTPSHDELMYGVILKLGKVYLDKYNIFYIED